MKKSLVLQTDFGLSDGAVSAMYGVSLSVDPDLKVFDLTHDIPAFHLGSILPLVSNDQLLARRYRFCICRGPWSRLGQKKHCRSNDGKPLYCNP